MKYFFLGICGISMRSLAVMLRLRGDEVSGCDAEPSDLDFFKTYGVEVLGSRVKEEIKKSDIIVFSSAIKENDENYLYAKKLGKKLMSRGELLGVIASDYDIVIAVAGAHGKTTTTALIYNILKKRNPTLHLGGILKEEDTCFVYGEKRYFITEACEYHDNFLYLKPYIGVITNIEKEHLDYFKTIENELNSFNKFRKNCKFVIEGNGGFEIKEADLRNHLQNELKKIDKPKESKAQEEGSLETQKHITHTDIANDIQLKSAIDALKTWAIFLDSAKSKQKDQKAR